MKPRYLHRLLLLTAVCGGFRAHAATIAEGDAFAGGIGYEWTVRMGGNETITTLNTSTAGVGVWSWHDSAFAGSPNMGWTHTSDWVALELTEAASLTIVMGRNSSVPDPASATGGMRPVDFLIPAFTVWQGWDNTSSEAHIYNNGAGSSSLAWEGGLSVIEGFVNNATEDTATLTLSLPAGFYTIALGSQGAATGGLPQQGYYATFATIPEPSVVLVSLTGGALLMSRRRR